MLTGLVKVEPSEARAVVWSFLYFFALLSSYYILRPVREEMGIQAGVGNLAWLFTATFGVMLAAVPVFGWLSARLPRRTLLPVVYGFSVPSTLLFSTRRFRRKACASDRPGFLRVVERLQSVRRVGLLELHGRPLHRRAGQTPVRRHRGGRHCGRPRGSCAHRRTGASSRAPASAADLGCLARVRDLLHRAIECVGSGPRKRRLARGARRTGRRQDLGRCAQRPRLSALLPRHLFLPLLLHRALDAAVRRNAAARRRRLRAPADARSFSLEWIWA